jgi:formylglycine-generating enzyme required for sulfatase activity
VTFAQWDACVSAGGCNGHRPKDRGWGRGNRPVIYVSWNDAKAYVKWLSHRTGKRYRLLSEAEWEYMARAKSTAKYPWGNSIQSSRAKYRWGGTVPVGRYAANAFGVHDTVGNISEWTEDCWHSSYQGARTNGAAWITGGNCGLRVLRGGSWVNDPRFVRSANRFRIDADYRFGYSGFRVARTLTTNSRDSAQKQGASPAPASKVSSVSKPAQNARQTAIRPAPAPVPPSRPVQSAVGVYQRPGDTFLDCAECPEMVVIQAGSFRMGDVSGGGNKSEKPAHTVNIGYKFAVGKYEVTQAAYQSVMGTNPSRAKGSRMPVEQVSWREAKEFARRLSTKTGKIYRLLTESEWEYVARAGTTTKYWWGEGASHEYANYGKDDCCDGLASGRDR